MKKIGAVQIVKLIFRPSVYTFDEFTHQLIFNRIIKPEELKKVIMEFGKEVTMIKNIRTVANQTGQAKTQRDLDLIKALEADLILIYNDAEFLADQLKNGSGTIQVNNTTIKFRKPQVVEFPDDQN